MIAEYVLLLFVFNIAHLNIIIISTTFCSAGLYFKFVASFYTDKKQNPLDLKNHDKNKVNELQIEKIIKTSFCGRIYTNWK